MKRLISLVACSLALTGCVGYRHIAVLENGGQSFADLQTRRDTGVALETLAPKDSVVVADDGGNLVTAATNEVSVVMVEPEPLPPADRSAKLRKRLQRPCCFYTTRVVPNYCFWRAKMTTRFFRFLFVPRLRMTRALHISWNTQCYAVRVNIR